LSTETKAAGTGSSRARAGRPRLGGSIANFAQRLGAGTDAARAATADNDHMPYDSPIVDLANRHADGLDVVLVWAQQTGRLWVTVTHRHSGRTARIDATPANALDVFRHPFAYRAVAQ
jgi:DNA-binding NtrC family response regulator